MLLVHHKDARADFWVPPGGSLEGSESIFDCARRETFEETGLTVEPVRLVYVEEFLDGPDYHFCKFWVLAQKRAGSIVVSNNPAPAESIVEAAFVSKADLYEKKFFPSILKDEFWSDLESGFPSTKYLGLRNIEL